MVRTEHQPAEASTERRVETSELTTVLDKQQLARRDKVWNRLMLYGFAAAAIGAVVASVGIGVSISDLSPNATPDAIFDSLGAGVGLTTFGAIAVQVGLPIGVVGAIGKMFDKPKREYAVTQQRLVK